MALLSCAVSGLSEGAPMRADRIPDLLDAFPGEQVERDCPQVRVVALQPLPGRVRGEQLEEFPDERGQLLACRRASAQVRADSRIEVRCVAHGPLTSSIDTIRVVMRWVIVPS